MDKSIKRISQIRRDNLDLLRKKAEDEFNKQYPGEKYSNNIFCDYIGIRTDFYYKLRIEKSMPKFSETYARSIEEHAKLPFLWMDQERSNLDFKDTEISIKLVDQIIKEIILFTENQTVKFESDESKAKLRKRILSEAKMNGRINQKMIIKIGIDILSEESPVALKTPEAKESMYQLMQNQVKENGQISQDDVKKIAIEILSK